MNKQEKAQLIATSKIVVTTTRKKMEEAIRNVMLTPPANISRAKMAVTETTRMHNHAKEMLEDAYRIKPSPDNAEEELSELIQAAKSVPQDLDDFMEAIRK